ncbi:MAG: LppP/LprE family lipoprotein [Vicinamibacterales bacterium]
MALHLFTVVVLAGVLAAPASWLDEPLQPWGDGPQGIPVGDGAAWAGRDACLDQAPEGPEAAQLRAAGWRTFQFSDRAIARGDVTVLAGLRALTPDCSPAAFQAFVFVAGQYAGTLSPMLMTAGKDGVVGMVRVLPDQTMTAEFARYAAGDSECCPSGRVRVTYRVERQASGPRVVPVDRKVIRE